MFQKTSPPARLQLQEEAGPLFRLTRGAEVTCIFTRALPEGLEKAAGTPVCLVRIYTKAFSINSQSIIERDRLD